MAGTITQQEKTRQVEPAPMGGPVARAREFPFFLSRLRDEFDRIFERFAGTALSPWGERTKGWGWGLEVMEKDNAIVVRAEAPGFEAKDFDVQVQDRQLMIRAVQKRETKKDGAESWTEQEYQESVMLPAGIDQDKVQAKYHNGVLTITMPRTAESKGRQVKVDGS